MTTDNETSESTITVMSSTDDDDDVEEDDGTTRDANHPMQRTQSESTRLDSEDDERQQRSAMNDDT